MQVETLGDALSLSWRVRMRCLYDGQEGLKHKRECGLRAELDMQTLVCTSGRAFHWRALPSACAAHGAARGISLLCSSGRARRREWLREASSILNGENIVEHIA
jgi:hypothetical protein